VKYNPFVTFPVLSCPVLFLSFTRPARTGRPILAVYGSNDVVLPKDGPLMKHCVTMFLLVSAFSVIVVIGDVSSEMLHVYGSWFCLPSCELVSGELQSSRWKGNQNFVIGVAFFRLKFLFLTVSDMIIVIIHTC